MTGMYLEHYGVKGMKWGVRKEYDPHPRKTTNIKPDSKSTKAASSDYIVQPFDNSTLRRAYDSYLSAGKQNFDYLQEWGEADDSKWDEAYAKAAEGFNDLERAMLVAYQMLVKYGLTARFSVCLSGKPTDKNPTIGFYDNKKNEPVATLQECIARNSGADTKTREKNVKGKPVAIKVNKSKSAGKSSVNSTTVPNSTIKELTKLKMTEESVKAVKDLMITIGKKKMSNAK